MMTPESANPPEDLLEAFMKDASPEDKPQPRRKPKTLEEIVDTGPIDSIPNLPEKKCRNAKGQFLKGSTGNPAGPGRKATRQLWYIKEKLNKAFTPRQHIALLQAAYKLGMDGNIQAMALFWDRTLGKVKEQVEMQVNHSANINMDAFTEADWQALESLMMKTNTLPQVQEPLLIEGHATNE